uniref:Uncharacterized protein n=1 Tax=Mesocestoides corti TaxID=53468 RepID=A0A5K3FUY4_MESCO
MCVYCRPTEHRTLCTHLRILVTVCGYTDRKTADYQIINGPDFSLYSH